MDFHSSSLEYLLLPLHPSNKLMQPHGLHVSLWHYCLAWLASVLLLTVPIITGALWGE